MQITLPYYLPRETQGKFMAPKKFKCLGLNELPENVLLQQNVINEHIHSSININNDF